VGKRRQGKKRLRKEAYNHTPESEKVLERRKIQEKKKIG